MSDRDATIRRLRAALHDDIEIVTERGDILEDSGGTQLVNGHTHDVEQWIDRRSH